MIVNSQRRIGLDLDEVIINLGPQKQALAKKFGIDLKPEETPSHVFRTRIPPDIFKKIQEIMYEDPECAPHLPFMDGALEGLRKIKASGHAYFLLSQRRNRDMAIKLLQERGLWPEIFDEANTFFVADEKEKSRKGRELLLDAYVDDWPAVLELFDFVPKRYLFDPLKAYHEKSEGFTVVRSWKELLPHLLN